MISIIWHDNKGIRGGGGGARKIDREPLSVVTIDNTKINLMWLRKTLTRDELRTRPTVTICILIIRIVIVHQVAAYTNTSSTMATQVVAAAICVIILILITFRPTCPDLFVEDHNILSKFPTDFLSAISSPDAKWLLVRRLHFRRYTLNEYWHFELYFTGIWEWAKLFSEWLDVEQPTSHYLKRWWSSSLRI